MKTFLVEAKQYLNNCMTSPQNHQPLAQHPPSQQSSPHHRVGTDSHNSNNGTSQGISRDDDDDHVRLCDDSYRSNQGPTDRKQLPAAAIQSHLAGLPTPSFYETMQRPFKSDKLRGRWSSSVDFYFACTSHALGSVIFSEISVYALLYGGVYLLPAYLVAILLYAIPIFTIHTFLGQFSSSGVVSALRVAPIFKGIGYSVIILNLTSLAYYGVLAAVPLIYAANSLHSVIPWMSCENPWNTVNCSTHESYDEEEPELYPHATVEFFRHVTRSAHADHQSSDWTMSWPLLLGAVGVWLFAMALLLQEISFLGKFFRCLCTVMLSCFIAIVTNLVIQHGVTWSSLLQFFDPILETRHTTIFSSMRAAIFMTTWLLGPGYGSVLTMASYNNFRRNSDKLTNWICGTHILLVLAAMLCGRIALDHFEDHVGLFHFHVEEEHFLQFVYLCFAYLFGSLSSLPSLWSFLFFSMLFLAELSAVIIQMRTVLTALFDEFEKLRAKKAAITVGLSMSMLLASIYFCSKQGFQHLHVLPAVSVLTHLVISLILLMITVWVYGRDRFQCDLQFMLGKTITRFKVFLLRFVTPVFLIISMFQVLFFLYNDGDPPESLIVVVQGVIYIVAPVYVIYKLCCTRGSLRNRLKQCFSPHDWYPVDCDNRRFYEEVMGVSEMLVLEHEQQQQFVNGP